MSYIVTLKEGTDIDTAISEMKGVTVTKRFDLGILVIECSEDVVDVLKIMPFVENVSKDREAKIQESDVMLFSDYMAKSEEGIQYLTESENAEVDNWVKIFEDEYGGDINNLDEGFLGRLIGGTAGFLIGPTIGKVVARALGIEKGILYDMFTSRLVSAALGAALAKSFEKK